MTFSKSQRASTLMSLAVLWGLSASQAHADNKLFVTDTLDRGQLDLRISTYHGAAKGDITLLSDGSTISSKSQGNELDAAVRYGLGASTHIGLSTSYGVNRSHQLDESSGNTGDFKAKGFQGGSVWVRHGFLTGSDSPLTLSGELGVDVATDKNLSNSSYSTASLSVAAGWDFGQGVKGYTALEYTATEHADQARSVKVNAGVWLPLNHQVTIAPGLTYRRQMETTYINAYSDYTLGLAAMVQVAPRTYINPSLLWMRSEAVESKNGLARFNETNGHTVGVQLYQLF